MLKGCTIMETICAMLVICICFCCFTYFSVYLSPERVYYKHALKNRLQQKFTYDFIKRETIEQDFEVNISSSKWNRDVRKIRYSTFDNIMTDSLIYAGYVKEVQ